MRLVPIVPILLLSVLAGCSGNDEPAAAPTATVTVTATPTFLGDPTEAATADPREGDPFAPNVGERALKIGEPRVGSALTTVLLEIEPGVTAEYRTPEQDKQFYGLRVSSCVAEDYDTADGDIYSTYPGEWYAVTKSGDQYTSSSSYSDFPAPKYPENVTINPGECVKGWIAVEVPATINRFAKFVWRPGGETLAEWLPR